MHRLPRQPHDRNFPDREPPADSADAAPGGSAYQQWGWSVTCHRDQVRLSLHRDVSALAIPIPLSTEIAEILTTRYCSPPVLAHPYTPDHHIMLTGERYGVPRPPTVTPRGPITWIQPPREDSLRQSREIDLFSALRTVVNVHLSINSTPAEP